ncbi:HupE/UreJ family protein [Marinobacter fonticola]|uniref:HupE/UreJ family protein n=1 Tax=Marinobacter fonticola TaxID=2603215 RepID=UPI0011E7B032|nr:HupE/UreJ family protein [Marinobacter fonticola]
MTRALCTLLLLLASSFAGADNLRPAYLQISETSANRFDVFWKVPARGNYARLSLNVRFDPSIQDVTERQGGFVGGAHVQRWSVGSDHGLADTPVRIEGLEKTTTEALMRIEYRDGTTTTHRFTPDAPDHVIAAKPTWADTVVTYFMLGVEHILLGPDHLLFVLVLLLLIRGMRKLIVAITAFTVAHSITLILASLEVVVVPVPPVEACIALSIVFVATEIIRGQQGKPGLTAQSPWIVAFSFGLLHGLGFAAALGEIGLPQNAIPTALVVFNVGVEAGQLLFVFAILALWRVLGQTLSTYPSWALRAPAYLIGSLASFWVFERVASF